MHGSQQASGFVDAFDEAGRNRIDVGGHKQGLERRSEQHTVFVLDAVQFGLERLIRGRNGSLRRDQQVVGRVVGNGQTGFTQPLDDDAARLVRGRK